MSNVTRSSGVVRSRKGRAVVADEDLGNRFVAALEPVDLAPNLAERVLLQKSCQKRFDHRKLCRHAALIYNAVKFLFELHENRISQIDLLIVTHFDKDHIGGVPEVLERVSVLRVIEPDYEPENPEAEAYTAYRAALDTAGITPEAISDALEVTLGDMQLSILGAGSTIYEKNADNNNSLVVTVTHCENRFFFAGDIEKQRIKRLLETGVFGCDVLKVPHHGAYNKQLPALFAALGMKTAVITCSEKNPAGEETLDALDALGCRIWQTANGTVRILSTKNGITVSQK